MLTHVGKVALVSGELAPHGQFGLKGIALLGPLRASLENDPCAKGSETRAFWRELRGGANNRICHL